MLLKRALLVLGTAVAYGCGGCVLPGMQKWLCCGDGVNGWLNVLNTLGLNLGNLTGGLLT